MATQKRTSHDGTRISRRIRQVTEGFNILAIIGEVDRSLGCTNEPGKQADQIGVGRKTPRSFAIFSNPGEPMDTVTSCTDRESTEKETIGME